MEQNGLRAETISFPRYGHTFFSASIAEYLNGQFSGVEHTAPHLAALLFAGDRFESRDLLFQADATHDVVILDRYVASNMAYQSARLNET